jgi:hypothetical protein
LNPVLRLCQDWLPSVAEFAKFGSIRRAAAADRRLPSQNCWQSGRDHLMKIYVAGNCQAGVLMEIFQAATDLPVEFLSQFRTEPLEVPRVVFAQPKCRSWLKEDAVWYPRIALSAFHPDILPTKENDQSMSPLRGYASSIVAKSWCESLTVDATLALFNPATFQRLRFFDHFEESKAQLLDEGQAADFPLEDLFERWFQSGCFMHTINHPKIGVMMDIAKILMTKAGLTFKPVSLTDKFAEGCSWPVYPELAARMGFEGTYAFRMHSNDSGRVLGLKEFVELSFANCAANHVVRIPTQSRLKTAPYLRLRSTLPAHLRGKHPYEGLPERQFWRKAHQGGEVDPVTTAFAIHPEMRVATAGSCFAQHISAALKANGFNYFVAETAPGEGGENYGVFSARYGNIYTARQLLQLFRRAYGEFTPKSVTWRKGARFVDPFRPEIESTGFESVEAVCAAREIHLEAVRRMFEKLDVFIFTLGLTEAWRYKFDGAIFPVAPGASGGIFDPRFHEFVNFGVDGVVKDLRDFLRGLGRVNAKARVILTVSPVPLVATYEPRHVLVSTTYSKAVLRVAADEIARSHANVTYFPSYEIVTGNFSRGRYFEDDLRSVTPDGVGHVMRMFFRHFSPDAEVSAAVREAMDVVCEEESLDPAVRAPLPPANGNVPEPEQQRPAAQDTILASIWRRLNARLARNGAARLTDPPSRAH